MVKGPRAVGGFSGATPHISASPAFDISARAPIGLAESSYSLVSGVVHPDFGLTAGAIALASLLIAAVSCNRDKEGKKEEVVVGNKSRPRTSTYGYTEREFRPGVKGNKALAIPIGGLLTTSVRLLATSTYDDTQLHLMSRALSQAGVAGGPPHLELAESIESSSDGKRVTVRLKPDLKWSDGVPITTRDIQFTMAVIAQPESAATDRHLFVVGGKPIEVEVVDDRTAVFVLAEPSGSFQFALQRFYLLPSHDEGLQQLYRSKRSIARGLGETPPDKILSNGPFRLKLVEKDRIVFEANPYYHKSDPLGTKLPYIEKIIFVEVPDSNSAGVKFRAGEVDMLPWTPSDQIPYLMKTEGVAVFDAGPSAVIHFLLFNMHPGVNQQGEPYVRPGLAKLFGERSFRRAVSLAIDRGALVRLAWDGRASEQHCFSTPVDAWHYDCGSQPHNPGEARSLLAQLGLRDSNGDNILEDPDGNAVSFTIIAPSENRPRATMLPLIANDLKEVGIVARQAQMRFVDVAERVRKNHDWEAVLYGFLAEEDPVAFGDLIRSSSDAHYWYPKQPSPATAWERSIDELFGVVDTNPDQTARREAYTKILKILDEQMPILPLVSPHGYGAAVNGLCNVAMYPYLPLLQNVEELWWANKDGECER